MSRSLTSIGIKTAGEEAPASRRVARGWMARKQVSSSLAANPRPAWERIIRAALAPFRSKTGPGNAKALSGTIKNAIFFLYLYCGYVQLRDFLLSRLGRSRAVVLYYHRVGGRDAMSKPVAGFRREIEYVKRRYECMSMAELCDRLESGAPLTRRTAVVTFDDGYRDNFTEAIPVLKQAGVTATFFVATGFIGTGREFPHDERALAAAAGTSIASIRRLDTNPPDKAPPVYEKLTWDDLRSMEADGFEIGSHTVNHANLGKGDESVIEREVRESLAALVAGLGPGPRAFSFPWGKPPDIPVRALHAVKSAGYYSACSAYGGSNSRGRDVFSIRRVDAGNGYLGNLAFEARIAGFDPDYLRLIVRTAVARLASKGRRKAPVLSP